MSANIAENESQVDAILKLHNLHEKSAGIIDGLPQKAVTVSAAYQDNHDAYGAKHIGLTANGCWIGKSVGDIVTIDLLDTYIVTGIKIQGRNGSNQFVSQFKLRTSQDGNTWTEHGPFIGNFDDKTIVTRRLKMPVLASFVIMVPVKIETHLSMSMDVMVV